MDKITQQLNRVLNFVELHGNASDKLAVFDIRAQIQAERGLELESSRSPGGSIPQPLKVRGVGRDPDDPTGRTLFVALDRKPDDDEMRALHDAWRN